MSVQNQIVKNVYEGNGRTTVFPYTFALNETDGEHVKVYIADESELSTPTDNFTIDTQLRTVTYPMTGAALPEGSKIVIRRELPNEQDTNLENNGAFFAETIEREFDREVMMIQQLAEQVDRAVKTDMSSVTTPDELIAELRAKAQAAVESASAALVSENNAKASASAAAQSETNAESYKDTTYGYMTTTEAYVTQAGQSATTATNKATEASASASAAAQSKTGAEAAADTAYDYMIEAGASESNATQSATNAANSATAAATSEANARTLVNTVNPPWNIRLASTEYAVGDIAYSALIPSWSYLECTVGGTTSSGDLPVPNSVVANDTFTDGTVTWVVCKIENMSNYTKTVNAPMFNKRDVITTSGTYTAPVTGWYKITVKGGGGGGENGNSGNTTYGGGRGGGEGGTTITYEHMTAGDSATVVIGAGGSANNNGGDSSVVVNGNTSTAYGGESGSANGAGGAGTIYGCCGGSGDVSAVASSACFGGSGGGAGGGAPTRSIGRAGIQGGGGSGGGTNDPGGAGGNGYVWFEYFATI